MGLYIVSQCKVKNLPAGPVAEAADYGANVMVPTLRLVLRRKYEFLFP